MPPPPHRAPLFPNCRYETVPADLAVDGKGAPLRGSLDQPAKAEEAVVSFEDDAVSQREAFVTGSDACRDGVWACMFLTHLAVVVVLAVTRGIPEYTHYLASGAGGGDGIPLLGHPPHRAHHHGGGDDDEWADYGAEANAASGSSSSNAGGGLLVCLVSALIAGIIALAMLELALKSPTAMVQFGLGGLIVSMSAIACSMVVAGPDLLGALFFSLAAAFAICFAISVQGRVPFAAANLAMAGAAVKKHRQTVTVAVGALFLQLLWLLVWLAALLGTALHHHRARQDAMPQPSANYELFEVQQAGIVDDDMDDHRSAGLNALLSDLNKKAGVSSSGSSSSSSSSGSSGSSSIGAHGEDKRESTVMDMGRSHFTSPFAMTEGDRRHANSGHHRSDHDHRSLAEGLAEGFADSVQRLLKKRGKAVETFAPTPAPTTSYYGYFYYDDESSGGSSSVGGSGDGLNDGYDDDFDSELASGLADALVTNSVRMGKRAAAEYYGLGAGCRSILVEDR